LTRRGSAPELWIGLRAGESAGKTANQAEIGLKELPKILSIRQMGAPTNHELGKAIIDLWLTRPPLTDA
jgi:hypothetical protein